VCPTQNDSSGKLQNDSSGKLRYPNIDVDKTEVLRKQVDGLVVDVKGLTCALFCLQ
jgi:hypothetical protein